MERCSVMFGSGRGADLTTPRRWINPYIFLAILPSRHHRRCYRAGEIASWRAARLAGSQTSAVARSTCRTPEMCLQRPIHGSHRFPLSLRISAPLWISLLTRQRT
uniref:Uncharacterized protein n=1 Tax=Arundo donax TaxID=35708 RepID=A0A0A9CHV1_ARUDO